MAQAASGIAQRTLYLHGEVSLVETVVGLAQDHVGTNNVALLQPLGQFGSRNDKPSTHAAARYIFTRLDPIAPLLFPRADFPVLTYRQEEGHDVEPEHYVPVLPMLLVNGAQGIGTGFATSVPSHSVRELIACVRAFLRQEPLPRISAHFEGFVGRVESTERGVTTEGLLERIGERSWRIRELPVGRWTDPFLSELKAHADGSKAFKGFSIVGISNRSTEFEIDVEVTLDAEVGRDELLKAFRLRSSVSTTHMYAFDCASKLRLFASAEEIFREHAAARLALYWRRRQHQLEELQARLRALQGKSRFIELVVSGALALRGLSRAELVGALRSQELPELKSAGDPEGFEYLLQLSVLSFTRERIDALRSEGEAALAAQRELEAQDAGSLWLRDLAEAEQGFEAYLARVRARHATEAPRERKRARASKARG